MKRVSSILSILIVLGVIYWSFYELKPSLQKEKPLEEHPFSALNGIFFFDVSNDEVFTRACGQRIDPETNTMYHLIYNPPPDDENIIHTRRY